MAGGGDAPSLLYQVECLGLPPRSFSRFSLGVSAGPAEAAAVLRATCKTLLVQQQQIQPLAFLLPGEAWEWQQLHARWGEANCVQLPHAYGVDLKNTNYGECMHQQTGMHTRVRACMHAYIHAFACLHAKACIRGFERILFPCVTHACVAVAVAAAAAAVQPTNCCSTNERNNCGGHGRICFWVLLFFHSGYKRYN